VGAAPVCCLQLGYVLAGFVDLLSGAGLVEQQESFLGKLVLHLTVFGVLLVRNTTDLDKFKVRFTVIAGTRTGGGGGGLRIRSPAVRQASGVRRVGCLVALRAGARVGWAVGWSLPRADGPPPPFPSPPPAQNLIDEATFYDKQWNATWEGKTRPRCGGATGAAAPAGRRG